jgi:Bacterial Ig-like domain (group 3)/Glycine rich protein
MGRRFFACFVSVGLLMAFLLPATAGAEPSGEAIYQPGDPFGIFIVPEGVHDVSITARGASGAQVRKTGASGHGAIVSGGFTVNPGEWLTVVVADNGGYGYGFGGEHGKVAGSAHDGAYGGGASAVESNFTPFLIAGGGGGGGGDNNAIGGEGGDAGQYGQDGQYGHYTDEGEFINEQITPGCGSCESGGNGGPGDSDHNPSDAGGGGGGGGGGAQGGSGGEHGYTFRSHDTEESGAGGGGGSSYVRPGAFNPQFGTDSQCVSDGTPSPACEGLVVISWGAPPAQLTASRGAGQGTPLTTGFEPIAIRATDANGIPVTDAPITFSVPGTGASGSVPGGGPTVVVDTDSTGVATLYGVTAQGAVGSWNLTASSPGISTQIPLRNQAIPVEVATTSSPIPSTATEPLELGAQVTGTVGQRTTPPTGAVQFAIDETPIGSPVALDPTTGIAKLPVGSVPPPVAGSYTLSADYLGDATHAAEEGREVQVVEKEQTAVSVEGMPDPVSDGSALNLHATITSRTPGAGPTGTVTFASDGTALGSAIVDGEAKATLDLGSLPLGSHKITATYSGDGRYETGGGEAIEVVDDAAVAAILNSSANPSTFGTGSRIEAQIRRTEAGPDAFGTVDFTVDGEPVCTAVPTTAAVAECVLPSNLAAGKHSVGAAFEPAIGSGDAATTGLMAQLVVPSPTSDEVTATPGMDIFDKPFALGSTVLRGDGAPATGAVQFRLDRFASGSPVTLESGRAGRPDACAGAAPGGDCPLGVGVHTAVSTFVPANGNLRPSQATSFIHVEPEATETSVRLAADARAGAPVSILTTVAAPSGPAEGSVQFLLDGTVLGAPTQLVDGSAASAPTRPLTSGPHEVVAHYLGAERFDPSESHLAFAAHGPTPVALSPKLRILSRGAAVNPDGKVRIRAACDGDPGTACDGIVYLRLPPGADGTGTPPLLARAHVRIEAGSTGEPRLALRGLGRKRLSSKRAVWAGVHFSGDGVDAALRLRSTMAPLLEIESVHRRYRAFLVQLNCLPSVQASSGRCEGEVELSADGERIGAVSVAGTGGAPMTARLQLPASYRFGPKAGVRVRVRSKVAVGEERISTGSFVVRPRVLGSRTPAGPARPKTRR